MISMSTSMMAIFGPIIASMFGLMGAGLARRHARNEAQRGETAALAQVVNVEAVKAAYSGLERTITRMEAELVRQDLEHEQAISILRRELDQLRADHRKLKSYHDECETERRELLTEIAELRGRR